MAGCHAHPFERASATCRTCSYEFCTECVVYTYGPEKPPFCIPCALQAAGVRSTAGRRPAPDASRARRRFGFRRMEASHPVPSRPAVEVPFERLAQGTGS